MSIGLWCSQGPKKPQNKHISKPQQKCPLSRNHDPAAQDNPQTLWWAVSRGNYFCSVSPRIKENEPLPHEEIHAPFGAVIWKLFPKWNCSRRGQWIIFSNREHDNWKFKIYFLAFWAPQAECPSNYIIFKRGQPSLPADIYKTLIPKQSRCMNCYTGKRENMDFRFCGELSL